jgi:hypothetical protein
MPPRNPDAVHGKAQAQVERLTKDVERYTKHVERDADSLERSRRKLADATAELEYARQHPALRNGQVVEATIVDEDDETVDDIPGQTTILPPVNAG